MKAMKIPKGWRRMRANEIIRKGDRFWAGRWYDSVNWIVAKHKVGDCASGPYIRKSRPLKKKGKT